MRVFAFNWRGLLLPLLIASLASGCGEAEGEPANSLGSLNASGPDTAFIGTVFTPTEVAVIVRSPETELKWDLEAGSISLFLGEDGTVLRVRFMVWTEVDTIATYAIDCEVEPSKCEPLRLSFFPERSVAFDGVEVPAAPQDNSWAWDRASAPIVLSGALNLGFRLSIQSPR